MLLNTSMLFYTDEYQHDYIFNGYILKDALIKVLLLSEGVCSLFREERFVRGSIRTLNRDGRF